MSRETKIGFGFGNVRSGGDDRGHGFGYGMASGNSIGGAKGKANGGGNNGATGNGSGSLMPREEEGFGIGKGLSVGEGLEGKGHG